MTDIELVRVDAEYDAQHSSNLEGRYASYLHSRAHLLHDDGEPLEPAAFAIVCWKIATSPVMAPGYVQWRADITRVTCRHTEDYGVIAVDVEVRLPWPELTPWPLGGPPMDGWQDWSRERTWSEHRAWVDPRHDDKPALLTTAHLLLPIHVSALPQRMNPRPWNGLGRRFEPGEIHVPDAKRTVAAICEHVNEHAGPVVAHLRAPKRGGRS